MHFCIFQQGTLKHDSWWDHYLHFKAKLENVHVHLKKKKREWVNQEILAVGPWHFRGLSILEFNLMQSLTTESNAPGPEEDVR